MVKMGLMDLITGAVGVKDLSGPVGIVDAVQETGNSAEKTVDGILNVLYFGAFIAVNLAADEYAAHSCAGWWAVSSSCW